MESKFTYVKLLKFFLFLCAFAIAGPLSSQILLQTSFEGSNPWAGLSNSQSCCSHSVTASTAQAHDGVQSFRAEVRANDPAVSSGYRAELTTPSITDVGDMWYGWSMYFEKSGTGNWNPGCCGHMVQWHPENGNGSASLSLWYTTSGGSAVWDVAVNPSGGQGVTHQTQRADGGPLLPIVANTWHDVVFHCNWTTGLIEFYLNGELYFSKSNLNYAGGPGQYFKFGMNRWTMSNTWVIYYDNLKIGRNVTYNDVAPTSTAPGNQPPVANAGVDQTITLPATTATLNGSATDADGTIASYAWTRVSGPTTFTITNPASALTTLTGLVQGTYVFRLTVTDDDGATDTDDVTVTVNGPVNQPPTANAGNNITITLPTNSTTLSGSGSDPDGTIASYAWSRVSGPTTFTLANANSATTALSNLVQGTYVFRLRVTDNNGATATDDVTVTVNAAPNQPPTANAGNNITITLPTNSTTLSGSGSDPDGTIASYAWSRVSGPTTFTLANANSATTALSNLVQGTYVFRLRVTDNSGATATDDVTVTVNAAPNQPPLANAGADITLTLPVNTTTLNGSAVDADGSIASYAWTRVSGPTTFTLANANSASTGLSNLVQGTYVFRLTVADDDGATDTDDVTVTVNASTAPPNNPPVANAGNNISITLPTNTATLSGTATDADGSIASYSWARISGPTTFTMANPNAATTAIGSLVQGTYVFRLTVTDDDGATATDDVTVTVNAAPPPPNQAPVANAGNDILLHLPANSTTLSGTGSTDSDGNIVSYAWARISGPASFTIANANAASTALSNLVQGVYVFRLTVTDNDGATAVDNVTVTVNTPPVANAGNNIVITLPVNTTTLNGSASSDPDGTISNYTWTRVSGPTSFTLANANAVTTGISNLVEGTYVFRLTVRDNRGATTSDEVTITVNPAPPPPPNQPPVARTAREVVVQMPNNMIQLDGSESTDPDGTIVYREWMQLAGPSSADINNPVASVAEAANLVVGYYIFELKVRDNDGAQSTDTLRVTVKNKNNEEIYCNLYPNPATTTINVRYIEPTIGNLMFSIYDANNRLISQEIVAKDMITLVKTIDINRLKAGVYFLKINGADTKVVRKFFKH